MNILDIINSLENESEKMNMLTFYFTAFITLISAILGATFSIHATIAGENREKEYALYMLARSIAIVWVAVMALIIHSTPLLVAITSAMLVIQIVDGIIGLYIKNPIRTIGPFIMALLHAICLYFCL